MHQESLVNWQITLQHALARNIIIFHARAISVSASSYMSEYNGHKCQCRSHTPDWAGMSLTVRQNLKPKTEVSTAMTVSWHPVLVLIDAVTSLDPYNGVTLWLLWYTLQHSKTEPSTCNLHICPKAWQGKQVDPCLQTCWGWSRTVGRTWANECTQLWISSNCNQADIFSIWGFMHAFTKVVSVARALYNQRAHHSQAVRTVRHVKQRGIRPRLDIRSNVEHATRMAQIIA